MSASNQTDVATATAPLDATVDGAVIEMERVSVRYRIPLEYFGSFKEFALRRLRRRVGYRDLLALREVSLTIGRGEIVGIIGRNGAGKSTLLKVIARVLRPTSGRVVVRGRTAPLLDVGAAFHPELTARENIYLNATLLGRSRREIDARLDEIVDFTELWEFIDAPLRTFSSGMIVRLGFAVATAWQPEILLIDEILAVGDEPFQIKSRARIMTFHQNGSTLLIVSHSADIVQRVCTRAVWLDHGIVRAVGEPARVVGLYHTEGVSS